MRAELCSGDAATLAFTVGDSYDFGKRLFSSTTDVTLTINNRGWQAATQMESVAPTAPFFFKGGSFPGAGGSCGGSLAGGDSCSLVLEFVAPSQQSALQESEVLLSYFDGYANQSVTLNLRARGDNGTFNMARGFMVRDGWGHYANTVIPVGDKLYIAGSFEGYDGTYSLNLVRLTADWTVDPDFSVGAGFSDEPAALAYDSTRERLYVAGYFSTYKGVPYAGIVALKPDASVDTGFSVGTGFDFDPTEMVLLPDGDLVLGGGFTTYQGTAANRIVRLNPDGSIDTSFAYGSGFNGNVSALALDGNNLYVGGSFTQYQGVARGRVVRLLTDGSVDGTFAAGVGFNSQVSAICLNSDGSGSVYVGGSFTTYQGVTRNRIVRLTSLGAVDGGFVAGTGFTDPVRHILSTPGTPGGIYVRVVGSGLVTYKGTTIDSFSPLRILANGTLDPAFTQPSVLEDHYYESVPVGDGTNDVYVVGGFLGFGATGSGLLARMKSDGSAVSSRLSSGFVSSWGSSVQVLEVAAGSAGQIWAGGLFGWYNGTSTPGLARLNFDGTFDSSFAVKSGLLNIGFGVYSILPYADGTGRVLIGGGFTNYDGAGTPSALRLNADGTRDMSFSAGPGQAVSALAFALDGTGKIYAGGSFFWVNGTAQAKIARLHTDGTLDTEFAVGSGFNGNVASIVPISDGSGDLYVAGNFTTYKGVGQTRIVRLNATGGVVGSFSPGTGFNASVAALVIAPDGDLYVAGNFTAYNGTNINRIARLNPDGSLDSAFDPGTSANDWITTIRLAEIGGQTYIYAVGDFGTFGGTAASNLVRLTSTGARDDTFVVGTGFLPGWATYGLALAPDGSGDIYVGGSFTSYQGSRVDALARINPDGSLD